MKGLMQDWPLLVHRVLDHAARWHGERPVVSRSVEGPIHRYTYGNMEQRARRLAAAAGERLKIAQGQVIATMAWNTYRHLEIWYGLMGLGAVVHTLNPRLFADQLVYIINHAEDRLVFIDLTFIELFERLAPRLKAVEGYVIMTGRERPESGRRVGPLTSAIAARRCGGPLLFFETPDNYLVALDARPGKERWHVEIADFDQQYFSTMAPIVVDNHVLVGTGNDLDAPGFLQSVPPETGKREWIFYTVPMNPGDPGLDTWPSLDAARHGGGQVWIPGSLQDVQKTKLYIFGTGNPTPGYTGGGRKGDNLYTGSLVAVNVDTGKMAWHFQTSPHDTHDWDSAQTQILIDGMINGKPRKVVSTAARNGYFFTVDRVTGEHIVTTKFGTYANWTAWRGNERLAGVRIRGRKRSFRARSSPRRKAA